MVVSVVAIGDELLAGHTLDTNSHWIAQRLRALGHPLKRVTQVRDRPEEIIAAVTAELAASVDLVITMGGLGPTPDDRTYESLAQALEVPLVELADIRARIESRLQRMLEAGLIDSADINEGHLRM